MEELHLFRVKIDPNYNQREYKRQQRKYDTYLARLRLESNRRKKARVSVLLAETATTTTKSSAVKTDIPINTSIIPAIIGTFSHRAKRDAETEKIFKDALTLSTFQILPHRAIIADKIQTEEEVTLQDLTIHTDDPRKERIAHLQHALFLAQEGVIDIEQPEPEGNIILILSPEGCPDGSGNTTTDGHTDPVFHVTQPTDIKIMTPKGETLSRNWREDFSDAQRSKIIADTINRRILCKSA